MWAEGSRFGIDNLGQGTGFTLSGIIGQIVITAEVGIDH